MNKQCYFCENGLEEGDLHHVSTYDLDANLQRMINELPDTQLLSTGCWG